MELSPADESDCFEYIVDVFSKPGLPFCAQHAPCSMSWTPDIIVDDMTTIFTACRVADADSRCGLSTLLAHVRAHVEGPYVKHDIRNSEWFVDNVTRHWCIFEQHDFLPPCFLSPDSHTAFIDDRVLKAHGGIHRPLSGRHPSPVAWELGRSRLSSPYNLLLSPSPTGARASLSSSTSSEVTTPEMSPDPRLDSESEFSYDTDAPDSPVIPPDASPYGDVWTIPSSIMESMSASDILSNRACYSTLVDASAKVIASCLSGRIREYDPTSGYTAWRRIVDAAAPWPKQLCEASNGVLAFTDSMSKKTTRGGCDISDDTSIYALVDELDSTTIRPHLHFIAGARYYTFSRAFAKDDDRTSTDNTEEFESSIRHDRSVLIESDASVGISESESGVSYSRMAPVVYGSHTGSTARGISRLVWRTKFDTAPDDPIPGSIFSSQVRTIARDSPYEIVLVRSGRVFEMLHTMLGFYDASGDMPVCRVIQEVTDLSNGSIMGYVDWHTVYATIRKIPVIDNCVVANQFLALLVGSTTLAPRYMGGMKWMDGWLWAHASRLLFRCCVGTANVLHLHPARELTERNALATLKSKSVLVRNTGFSPRELSHPMYDGDVYKDLVRYIRTLRYELVQRMLACHRVKGLDAIYNLLRTIRPLHSEEANIAAGGVAWRTAWVLRYLGSPTTLTYASHSIQHRPHYASMATAERSCLFRMHHWGGLLRVKGSKWNPKTARRESQVYPGDTRVLSESLRYTLLATADAAQISQEVPMHQKDRERERSRLYEDDVAHILRKHPGRFVWICTGSDDTRGYV